jgi:putative isomerase
VNTFSKCASIAVVYLLSSMLTLGRGILAEAQSDDRAGLKMPITDSSSAEESSKPVSHQYGQVQRRLARSWNTWDVHSVTTHVLLPEGLAIHIGLMHNSAEGGDTFLPDTLIGRLTPGAEQVFPGEHSWDGSYTDLRVSWKGHSWRIQSARDGDDLVLLASPLPSNPISALPPTITFSVNFLWNRSGTTLKHPDYIETRGASGSVSIYCTCTRSQHIAGPNSKGSTQDTGKVNLPIDGPYFSTDFIQSVGISTGKPRTLTNIESVVERQHHLYQQSISAAGKAAPIVDAIETTLGWDTIFEPKGRRVVSPVSRVWSVGWGGYVIFDWDTFFAATMASIGDRDLAYADAIETLHESTEQGFVPNYARTGGWKSSDRSEPPVGSITVLGLYRKFHDRWFLEETFQPLLQWNRWWTTHRDVQGYLTWGSDGENKPVNLDDGTRGTRAGAILESGLDNSPMYDDTTYNPQSHLLDFADVGLMSMYIATMR